MKKARITWCLMLALALLLSGTPGALAKGKGDGGPGGFDKGEKKGWEGDRPPGWSQGEKKGWGEGDMPPGLAKKSGEGLKGHKGKKGGKGKKKG